MPFSSKASLEKDPCQKLPLNCYSQPKYKGWKFDTAPYKSLILSWFRTEGTRTNFEGFVWDAIKLWSLIRISNGNCNSELIYCMRASLRILYKNMTSHPIISKKIICDVITSVLYNISSTVYLQLQLFSKLVEQEDKKARGNKHFHPCKFSLLFQKAKEKIGTAPDYLHVQFQKISTPHPPCTEASLASLTWNSSRALTEWSAIFAFGVWPAENKWSYFLSRLIFFLESVHSCAESYTSFKLMNRNTLHYRLCDESSLFSILTKMTCCNVFWRHVCQAEASHLKLASRLGWARGPWERHKLPISSG